MDSNTNRARRLCFAGFAIIVTACAVAAMSAHHASFHLHAFATTTATAHGAAITTHALAHHAGHHHLFAAAAHLSAPGHETQNDD